MGGPGAGGVINTLRIRRVAQRLGQGAANYSDALSQTAAARGRGWRTRHRRSCWGATVECIENASTPQRWRREGEQAPAEIPQGILG